MIPKDHSRFVVVFRAAFAMELARSRRFVADWHRLPMPDDAGNRAG